MKLKYLLILLPFILVSCNQKKAKKETTMVKETRQLPKLEPSN
ncbi:unnamed protein product, partial [Ectocarpus sp. 12 AP-2014]